MMAYVGMSKSASCVCGGGEELRTKKPFSGFLLTHQSLQSTKFPKKERCICGFSWVHNENLMTIFLLWIGKKELLYSCLQERHSAISVTGQVSSKCL